MIIWEYHVQTMIGPGKEPMYTLVKNTNYNKDEFPAIPAPSFSLFDILEP